MILYGSQLTGYGCYSQKSNVSRKDLKEKAGRLLCSPQVHFRELKQQTFAIHGGQPELKLHKSCALRMSHGRRGLSRRAPMNFSRPCRFATILILHGFLRR